jgi:paraquat-inducible protein A
MPADTAASRNLASCHLCRKLADASLHQCPRCGEALHLRKANTLQRTLALLVTASLLYIPANMLPMMAYDTLGNTSSSTILGGVIELLDYGDLPVALVIFIASIMVPVGKIIAMYYLCWCISKGRSVSARQRTVMYRITEQIGKWSMIDVFVVSILVALVHLNGLLVILPGTAAIAFCGVVIVTIIAAESFDPRIFWDQQEQTNE